MAKPTVLIPALFALALFAGTALAADPASVWLVRHAEAGPGHDPALTEAGVARADAWHAALGAPAVEVVFVTDTERSRATGGAIAEDAGARVELYDPAQPERLVERLEALGVPAVVVAHSNTLLPLVTLLGGGSHAPIAHDEHDRVYRLPVPVVEPAD